MGNPPPFCRGGFSLPLPVPPCKRPWGRAGGVPGGGLCTRILDSGGSALPRCAPPPLTGPPSPSLVAFTASFEPEKCFGWGEEGGCPPRAPHTPTPQQQRPRGGPRVPPPHASPIPLPPALPAHLHTAGGGQRGGLSPPYIAFNLYFHPPHTPQQHPHTGTPICGGGDRILASPPPPFISCP